MRILATMLMALVLAGCGSLSGESRDKPVGVGGGRDEYKYSPCRRSSLEVPGIGGAGGAVLPACYRIDQLPGDEGWISRMQRAV